MRAWALFEDLVTGFIRFRVGVKLLRCTQSAAKIAPKRRQNHMLSRLFPDDRVGRAIHLLERRVTIALGGCNFLAWHTRGTDHLFGADSEVELKMKTRKGHWQATRPRKGSAAAIFRPSLDRIPALLALLAIVIQCFVVQSHIHAPLGAAFAPAASGITQPGTDSDEGSANLPRGKFPGGDDPSNCRLCQELVHAGRFVTPVVALLVAPLVITLWLLVLSKASPAPLMGSHTWRSRAPPQA